MKPNIKLEKLDVVRRQTETAVRMYFFDGDPVSIHTLVAASHEVISDLSSRLQASPTLLKESVKLIKPEHETAFIKKLREPGNFFKHADRDHDDVLEFSPAQTEFLLFDVCNQYHKFSDELPPLMKTYYFWFMINNGSIFTGLPEEASNFLITDADHWIKRGRQPFFTDVLPLLMRNGVSE